MPSRHGAFTRANSVLNKLHNHVERFLDAHIDYEQLLTSTRDEVRRVLPALSDEDGERIADFVIDQACEEWFSRKRSSQEDAGCRILAFPDRPGGSRR